MLTCNDCLNKICLIKGKGYGKPCKEIEIQLRSEGIKSREWIRPRISNKLDNERGGYGRYREIPISSLNKQDFPYQEKEEKDDEVENQTQNP